MANYDITPNPKRVRYFDGQFLIDQDFIDEQNYHRDRQQRHLQTLHLSGIVEGLEVTKNGTVTVSPGTAIDNQGNQLVLAAEQNITSQLNGHNGDTVWVSIKYQQVESDDSNVPGEKKRFDETPSIQVTTSDPTLNPPNPDPAPVVLAKITIESTGNFTNDNIDNSVRQYSGLRLPSSANHPATLRATQNGGVLLTTNQTASKNNDTLTALTIKPVFNDNSQTHVKKNALIITSGNVGIGTSGSQSSLSVSGGVSIGSSYVSESVPSGKLIVEGKVGIGTTSPTKALSVNGDVKITQAIFFADKTQQSINLWKTTYGIGVQPNTLYHRTNDSFAWYKGGSHTDNQFQPGSQGKVLMVLNGEGKVGIGTTLPKYLLDVNGNVNLNEINLYNVNLMHILGAILLKTKLITHLYKEYSSLNHTIDPDKVDKFLKDNEKVIFRNLVELFTISTENNPTEDNKFPQFTIP